MSQIASRRRRRWLQEIHHALFLILILIFSLQFQPDMVQGQGQRQARGQEQEVEEGRRIGPRERVAKQPASQQQLPQEEQEPLFPTEQDMSRLLERVVLQGQPQILEEEKGKRRLPRGQQPELLVRQGEEEEVKDELRNRLQERDPLDAAASAVLQQQQQLLQQEQKQQQQLLQQRQQHPPLSSITPEANEASRSHKQQQQQQQVPENIKDVHQPESDHLPPPPPPPPPPLLPSPPTKGTKILPGTKGSAPLSPPPTMPGQSSPMPDIPSQDRAVADSIYSADSPQAKCMSR